MTDVGYSHGAPARPYDPSYFQHLPFLAPCHPYGKSPTPIAAYQQPWNAPHVNQRSRGRGYPNQHQN